MGSVDTIVTALPDLTDYPLRKLRTLPVDQIQVLVDVIKAQIDRAQANFGASGPPGRAD